MTSLAARRRRFVIGVLTAPLCAGLAAAQIGGNGSLGAYHPVADTVLDTSLHRGVFQFTSITIPAGVTVRLRGPNPAILLSQGDVKIEGTLDANGAGGSMGRPPGGFAGGAAGCHEPASPGQGPGGGAAPNGNATHASTYGAAYPFDLRGGSGGGGSQELFVCGFLYPNDGGAGGGTVVILADRSIEVGGQILANGEDASCTSPCISAGSGSGGSIMLRALSGVRVRGAVRAEGASTFFLSASENGFVRIDSYGTPPVLRGVSPAPTALELPEMRTVTPPRIGESWDLRIASVPGDVVLIVLAGETQQLAVPPFGVLTLAGPFAGLGVVTVPSEGHDPQATFSIPIASSPALVGLTAYLQGFNGLFTRTGRPRLTNGVQAVIAP